MLRNLVRNTSLNVAIFGVSGVLGLLTSGWTVAAYGLHYYGITAFARNLVPSGFLGILDMGVPDAATRLVAGGVARRAQSEVDQYISATLLLGAIFGLAFSIMLTLGSHIVAPLLMRLEYEDASEFASIVFWSGLAAFPLMVNQAAEGVLKGMNRFRAVRLAELFANVLFAIFVFWITASGREYVDIAYAFLLTGIVRFIANVGWLLALNTQRRWAFRLPSRECRARIYESSGLLWRMKLTGAANGFLPPFLIAQMLGPAGVGVYDILLRIPRLIKVVVGVTTQALIPPAAMLDARDDAQRLGRLGMMGTFMLLVAITPLIIAGMLASDIVLTAWLGKTHASLAPWLALSLAWPLLLATYQVGNAVLTVRVEALAQLNRVNFLQLVLTLGVAVVATAWWQEKSFIIALVVFEVVFLPYRIWIYSRHVRTSAIDYWGVLARVAAASIPALGVNYLAQSTMSGGSQTTIISVAAFGVTHYLFLVLIANADERREFVNAVLNMPFIRRGA
jgi:O-antigen/teichoic acid export membrane protein